MEEENKDQEPLDNQPNEEGENEETEELSSLSEEEGSDGENIVPLDGMFENWFLDYASYVILERAVPSLVDGLKPVQRRIMHAMKELDDGRYNKVANIIGNTMKYHPHGDASIGDALVQIGQKDIAVDMQGNWGNLLTGDGAAAARYIEARLSKFAAEVMFNGKTTNWLLSYDGRNKEPEHLPIKFPLLLAQGAEGIAVGLACKILPHNFIELIDACVDSLKGKKTNILPDFHNGGMADFTAYNNGLRGGKIRVRARIRKEDSKTLIIYEIPFGTTTTSLIESVLKANEKGKIKIRKIEDNTAAVAEILVHLPAGVSPDKMIDALYAFTDCEMSISPNSCVIIDDKPVFMGVNEMLEYSANHTKKLLNQELEIRKAELNEQWHFSSLEKIFIENRIYRDIEEETTWEGVLVAIDNGLKPFKKLLKREVHEEDLIRLTEIKIKRISKFDTFKADEIIRKIEEELAVVLTYLENLTEYAVDYFKNLKKKYAEGRERKTEIRVFDNIRAKGVIIANRKLYVNKEEGFIGWTLKKDDFIQDCSEIDDVIVFKEDGKMLVTKIADKKYVGKMISHVAIWKKADKRTIYHFIYQDGKNGPSYMKRFNVTSITRDKEYDLTKGTRGSKVHYFQAHPNGEREVLSILLRPRPHLKKLKLDVDFGELLIKGRGASGNRLTKELISKISQKEIGGSTLAARKVWYDDVVKRLNDENRGRLVGSFKGEDKILTIYASGNYLLSDFNLSNRYDDDLIHLEKWIPDHPISCVYLDGEKDLPFVKRFLVESSTKKMLFISETENSELIVASTEQFPRITISFNKHLKSTKHLLDKEVFLDEFISIKGMKAIGNVLTKLKTKSIELLPEREEDKWPVEEEIETVEVVEEVEIEENLPIESDDSEKAVTIELDVTYPKKEEEDIQPDKPNGDPFIEDDDEQQMNLFGE